MKSLGGEVATSLRSMLDYGKAKSRNISKNQRLALRNNMDLIFKDVTLNADDIHVLNINNNGNSLSLLEFLSRAPAFNNTLYKMNEKTLTLINRVVYFHKYKSAF